MIDDLFGQCTQLEPLSVADADFCFARRLALPEADEVLLQKLTVETPWRSERITVWGKTQLQPRLTAWYGDAGRRYAYADIQLEPLPWTPTLLGIRAVIEALTHTRFNSVLLNYYRDQRDSMGMHSDDEPELGPRPTIASLSLGATRTFVLQPKRRSATGPVRIALPSGSLLVMQGQSQQRWKHGIDKQSKPCGPRINLTFRTIDGLRQGVAAGDTARAAQEQIP